jgi:hypothetical protein
VAGDGEGPQQLDQSIQSGDIIRKTTRTLRCQIRNEMASDKIFVADVQGFSYGAKTFFPREIAVVRLKDSKMMLHAAVRQPLPFHYLRRDVRSCVDWTSKNVHRMLWETKVGIPLEAVGKKLADIIPPSSRVLVKDLQKACSGTSRSSLRCLHGPGRPRMPQAVDAGCAAG